MLNYFVGLALKGLTLNNNLGGSISIISNEIDSIEKFIDETLAG